MENAEENDLEDERLKMNMKSVECMSVDLLILITWMMSGNR